MDLWGAVVGGATGELHFTRGDLQGAVAGLDVGLRDLQAYAGTCRG